MLAANGTGTLNWSSMRPSLAIDGTSIPQNEPLMMLTDF